MRKYAAAFFLVFISCASVSAGQDALPSGWTAGPASGKLGTRASITVPEGYVFLDAAATKAFLEENQNIPNGDELGTLLRVIPETEHHWFAVFSYSDTGHIDDGEKDDLDAGALMKSMQAGSRRGNEERKRRGWTPLTLVGWQKPPFYDTATNNLTWSTRIASDGEESINHSVRLLGRTGIISAQLVADPDTILLSTIEFEDTLKTFSFTQGSRYAEFRKGDKVAEYGLTALIAGGAGAAAVKSGLLGKLWKGILLAFAAFVGFLKRLFGKAPENNQPVPAQQ